IATIQDAAPTEVMAVGGASGRKMMRFVGPLVVVVALLSALATFLVLAGLTPIPASHEVVLSLLGVNPTAVLLLVVIILRELWPAVAARRPRGRAAACEHRQPVLGDRGDARDPGRPGRQRDPRSRRQSAAAGQRLDQRHQHGGEDLRPGAPAGARGRR